MQETYNCNKDKTPFMIIDGKVLKILIEKTYSTEEEAEKYRHLFMVFLMQNEFLD
jgi:hypothetical protein